jgi:hypothetical protein
VVMKSEREFTGTLLGFDDYVSEWLRLKGRWILGLMSFSDIVLEDVTE